jgi:hypothetical protein
MASYGSWSGTAFDIVRIDSPVGESLKKKSSLKEHRGLRYAEGRGG